MIVLQLVYASFFVLLSIICCLICLAIPRLRKYAIQTLVAPVAFGFFALGGMAIVGIGLNLSGIWESDLNPVLVIILYAVYGACGFFGAWAAIRTAGRLLRMHSK